MKDNTFCKEKKRYEIYTGGYIQIEWDRDVEAVIPDPIDGGKTKIVLVNGHTYIIKTTSMIGI